ncbi:hypothetical protein B1A99_20250 [Cohnella sp. CIP 111063]|uniref:hypothetical protein n=1 Tax=unclassified Cohnella TaxID=2636738 RepID=UPI000B8BF00D|nr:MULTISPECIES: hypothetical protein [unclassified Cohnella]OXS56649.1 hypothetical protein B1A99_20250 [Cohnella sp. CIP 111063]PRX68845.1 hypothetical protein B0G52_113175 [Cohnella sp. SGD-V74]
MALVTGASYNQDPGVGRGYFSSFEPLGTNGTVQINNSNVPVRLVITRYGGLPPFEVDIPGNSTFAVSINHIQTIGVLNIGGLIASGSVNLFIPE